MENITPIIFKQSFLELHAYELQFSLLFGGILLLLLLEGFIPRREVNNNQTNRWLSNIGITLLNHFFILFYVFFVIKLLNNAIQQQTNFLQSFQLSNFITFPILLVIMEFITYWIHRAYHKIPLLWRIHAVHHSDTDVDVTTSHRHHPLEPMINTLIIIPVIFALDASPTIIIIYNLTQIFFSLITHSNIVLPKSMDNILRLFVVTPDFHRIHHSSDKTFTDSNYGGVFPWFDYLFKTATHVSYEENAKMELGLEIMRKPDENRLDKMLLTPLIINAK